MTKKKTFYLSDKNEPATGAPWARADDGPLAGTRDFTVSPADDENEDAPGPRWSRAHLPEWPILAAAAWVAYRTDEGVDRWWPEGRRENDQKKASPTLRTMVSIMTLPTVDRFRRHDPTGAIIPPREAIEQLLDALDYNAITATSRTGQVPNRAFREFVASSTGLMWADADIMRLIESGRWKEFEELEPHRPPIVTSVRVQAAAVRALWPAPQPSQPVVGMTASEVATNRNDPIVKIYLELMQDGRPKNHGWKKVITAEIQDRIRVTDRTIREKLKGIW